MEQWKENSVKLIYHSKTIFFRYPRVPRPASANLGHLLETNPTRHELEAHLKPTNPTWEILNMRPSRKKSPKSQAIPLGFIVQPLTLKFQANYSSFTTLTMTVYEEFQEQKLHNTWERKKKYTLRSINQKFSLILVLLLPKEEKS